MRMRKNPKIFIRSQVRSRAYKSALRDGRRNFTCGFLLGRWEMPYEEARINFALPVEIVRPSGLDAISERLDQLLQTAQEVAEFCKSNVIGIFAAYDAYLSVGQNQMIGYLCDYARQRGLSYFLQFPTDGGETIWGIGVYNAKWFPHEAFSYQMVSQRASDKPYDNPRRVHRLWTRLSSAQLLESATVNRQQVYVWRQEFSCERLKLIRQIRWFKNQLFHGSEELGSFARIQLSGSEDLMLRSSFDGIIDGRNAEIYLKVISLKLWFAWEVYRRALAHTEKRYPGYDRHHFEDGSRIGERLLVFDSDTHMLAWHHLGRALCAITEDDNITVCESYTVVPYQQPSRKYGTDEWGYAVTLVIDREQITWELLHEVEEVVTSGNAWPVSDTPKSYGYYEDALCDLFSELSYPELVVLNNEEALAPLREVDYDLFEACRYLDIKKIRLALHRGANPNAIMNPSTDTPLMQLVESIRENHWAILYSDKNQRGKYPVVQLSAHDKVAMVELLLEYGAHPDVHWFENTIPLAIAAINNEEEIVATLLKHGSDPAIQSYFDLGIEDWPTAWDYATDDHFHESNTEKGSQEWLAHERIVAMLERLRPTPYYVQSETSEEQTEKPHPEMEGNVCDLDVYTEIQWQAMANPLVMEMPEAERKYIESSDDPALARLCLYLALAYNTQEPRWILEHCSPDVEYTSQSVFQTLQGIAEFGDYLKQKLLTLSQTDEARQARFELGYSPDGRPCVIGYQRQGKFSFGIGERMLWMDIEHDEEGRFRNICAVTSVPPASAATGASIFPGISEESIKQELVLKPHKIPEQLELLFKVFVLEPMSKLDEAMIENTRTAIANLPNASVVVKSTGSAVWADVQECNKYNIVSLPNLVVEHDGELVMQLSGVRSSENIRERLAEYVFPCRLIVNKQDTKATP